MTRSGALEHAMAIARRARRPVGLAAVVIALPLGVVLTVEQPRFAGSLDNTISDFSMRHRSGPPPPTDLTAIGYDRVPTRSEMARLVRLLNRARVAGIDLKFSKAKDPEGSKRLRRAIRRNGRVVLSSGRYDVYPEERYVPFLFGASRSALPAGAETGGAGYVPDADKVIRSIRPNIVARDANAGQRVPLTETGRRPSSFAHAVARAASDKKKLPAGKSPDNRVLINFRGRGNPFEVIPFEAVLRGDINERAFDDQIVVVGATAKVKGFGLRTPIAERTDAVTVDANAVATLLENVRLGPESTLRQGFLLVAAAFLPLLLVGPWPRWLPGLLSGPKHELAGRLALAVSTFVLAVVGGEGIPSLNELMYWPWSALTVTAASSLVGATLLKATTNASRRGLRSTKSGALRASSHSNATHGSPGA